ncbi:hypothetical protein MK852_13065 [Shewanella benthica]|nr:hypothetical protein [Shewanella benthica]
MKIIVSPKGGWSNFYSSDELIKLVWDSLPKSSWEYYNFTSDSSIWTNGENTVIAKFTNDECIVLEKLEFNIVGDNKYTDELKLLISKLQSNFGVTGMYS